MSTEENINLDEFVENNQDVSKKSTKESYKNISNHMGEIMSETLQRSKIYLLFGFFLFYLVIFLS